MKADGPRLDGAATGNILYCRKCNLPPHRPPRAPRASPLAKRNDPETHGPRTAHGSTTSRQEDQPKRRCGAPNARNRPAEDAGTSWRLIRPDPRWETVSAVAFDRTRDGTRAPCPNRRRSRASPTWARHTRNRRQSPSNTAKAPPLSVGTRGGTPSSACCRARETRSSPTRLCTPRVFRCAIALDA
jgi:hypothetical protein